MMVRRARIEDTWEEGRTNDKGADKVDAGFGAAFLGDVVLQRGIIARDWCNG